MTHVRNIADPDREPTDDDLADLMREAFAGLPESREQRLRAMREGIVRAQRWRAAVEPFVRAGAQRSPASVRVKLVAVGGAAGRAANALVERGLNGVEFVAIDTGAQHLEQSRAPLTHHVHRPGVPGLAAEATGALRVRIEELVAGADVVLVIVGLGGETGSSLAPLVVADARARGAHTVTVCTRPAIFEGSRRRRRADEAIEALSAATDALIIVPIQDVASRKEALPSSPIVFRGADEWVAQAVEGLVGALNGLGPIRIDLAGLRTISGGKCILLSGSGRTSGQHSVADATQQVLERFLLDGVSLKGALMEAVVVIGSQSLTGGLASTGVGPQALDAEGAGTGVEAPVHPTPVD